MAARRLLSLTAALLISPLADRSGAADPFNFAQLQGTAEKLAEAPQVTPRRASDEFFKLDYDAYRLISPRHDTALWRDTDSPFWVEFFAAGSVYEYPVTIHVVESDGSVSNLEAGEQWFQYRGAAEKLAEKAGGGFSGLRLLAQQAGEEHKTEFAVFQGASYFRARGGSQWYGASARGLAVDVGLHTPEEFPRFLEIWLHRPKPTDKQAKVWALMNSPGVTGAYQFLISTGPQTTMEVEAYLWFRHGLQKLGIAPLTSMWMWDDTGRPENESRPEVHDSDGLLIHRDNDEWIWRPVRRPETPRVSKWDVNTLHGFGLLQRDRDQSHYQDTEAHYDRRPSLWVTPAEPWGPGHVELLELPSHHEGGDNLGAYWVSDEPITGPTHRVLKYSVTFGEGPQEPAGLWTVTNTRVTKTDDGALVEVEFTAPSKAPPDSKDIAVTPEAASDAGEIRDVELIAEDDGRQVLRFHFAPPTKGAARLQAELKSSDKAVSEQWSFQWTPL